MQWSRCIGFLHQLTFGVVILSMGIGVTAGQAEEPGKPSIRLSPENRERCLTILRAGFKSDEFWPSMHAAEALTLAGYGAEVRVALEPLLVTDKDAQHRCGLAREMARAGDTSKVAILLEVLADPDTYGHTHAAESLFKIGQVGDGTLLRKTMRETKDAKRQLMAAAALAKSGDRDAMALVRQKLNDNNPEARKIAAWILIRLGDPSDLPALRKNAARDNTPVDQAYVMYALACLGDAAGLAELERNYKNENVEIRTFAAEFTSVCRAVHLADKLTALLSDPVLDVRIRAAQSLLMLASEGAARAEEPPSLYRSTYRVINVHRHCGIATEAAVRAEIEVLDRVGMDKVVILDGNSPRGNLPAWLKLQQEFPERLVVFAKIDFSNLSSPTFFQDLVRDLERDAKLGIKGVKVWKDLGMYLRDGSGKLLAADDPRLDPFWARCGELGLPVLLHAADSKEYWHPLTFNSVHYGLRSEKDQHYNNPDMPSWDELIRQRDHVLEKHPRTMFIGAHMGSLSLDLKLLGETFDKYPNFHVDCAATLRVLGRLNPPAVRDFFTKYQDRILFGTDDMVLIKGRRRGQSGNISIYPNDDPNLFWIDPQETADVRKWQDRAAYDYSQYLQYFETDRVDLMDPNRSGGAWLRIAGVRLPPEVLEKFYHGNAERLNPGLGVERKQ